MVLVAVLSIAAVTFLGTSSSSSSGTFTKIEMEGEDGGFVPVGPAEDDPAGGWPAEPEPDPAEEEAYVPGITAFHLAADELAQDGWIEDGAHPDAARRDAHDLCTEAETGAVAIVRGQLSHPDLPDRDGLQLTVDITAYDDEGWAEDALARVASESWRTCVTERAPWAEATFELLPDDPAAPGIAYAVDTQTVSGPFANTQLHVLVGSMRAVVRGCACSMDAEREAARDVAVGLALAQGLEPPG